MDEQQDAGTDQFPVTGHPPIGSAPANMDEPQAETTDLPPVTGNQLIDSALAGLAGSDRLPVDEQLERLSAAHDALAQVLESSRNGGLPMPNPGSRPQ